MRSKISCLLKGEQRAWESDHASVGRRSAQGQREPRGTDEREGINQKAGRPSARRSPSQGRMREHTSWEGEVRERCTARTWKGEGDRTKFEEIGRNSSVTVNRDPWWCLEPRASSGGQALSLRGAHLRGALVCDPPPAPSATVWIVCGRRPTAVGSCEYLQV